MTMEDEIKLCKKCNLYKTCKSPIAWDWNLNWKILIIWEAPWKDEDINWIPFVWKSWKLLTKILEDLGYFRYKDYYITNIVKCRPPNNRDPKIEEINICSLYLINQIETIKPKLIITLWRFSFNFLVPNITISNWRWKLFKIKSINKQKLNFLPILLPVYHPASALYDPTKLKIITEDLKKIKIIL